MCWAILNPAQGIMEPLDIPDYETILHIASPLLGQLSAVRTNWTPLAAAQRAAALYPGGGGSAGGRGLQVDASDPWQFCNFRLE
jgi:homospermidine synthase